MLAAAGALAALLLLAGCDMKITNLTPPNVASNPSHIYTITASFMPTGRSVDRESIQPRIVIDGRSFPMSRSATMNVWEFEYQLPPNRTEARYYFLCDFAIKSGADRDERQAYSEPQVLQINGRYLLGAEATRAPVGARVNIVGAGFTPGDIVYFNSQPTRTVFESPASLSFFVPAVTPGLSYQLKVAGPGGELAAGTFRVDGTDIAVSPAALTLTQGESQLLTFTLPSPAPAGGMLIDVTTDAPASIIMPEVLVPPGQTVASVTVQGGAPGSGSLFLKGASGEIVIPLTVNAR